MRKRTLIVILLVFPVMGIFSCWDCEDTESYFDMIGLECQIFYRPPNRLPDGKFAKLTNGQGAVPFNGHYIDVYHEASYYSLGEVSPGYFTQPASADDCYNSFISEEGLDTLYVITSKAYDENHPANDTINDIVSMGGEVNYYNGFNDYSGAISLQEYVSANQPIIQGLFARIRLNQEPQYKQESHSFTIIYELLNGERHVAETNEILFE